MDESVKFCGIGARFWVWSSGATWKFKPRETAKLDCVCSTFFPWQWVSRDLALAWVLGASQAQRRDVAADPEPKINVQNQTGRDGRMGRTWAERLQQQDCNQGLQREHGQAHREGGDGREQESLWVLGPLEGPRIILSAWNVLLSKVSWWLLGLAGSLFFKHVVLCQILIPLNLRPKECRDLLES